MCICAVCNRIYVPQVAELKEVGCWGGGIVGKVRPYCLSYIGRSLDSNYNYISTYKHSERFSVCLHADNFGNSSLEWGHNCFGFGGIQIPRSLSNVEVKADINHKLRFSTSYRKFMSVNSLNWAETVFLATSNAYQRTHFSSTPSMSFTSSSFSFWLWHAQCRTPSFARLRTRGSETWITTQC